MRLGYNTYCLRSLKLRDEQLLDFAVEHELDAVFLQDTTDPRAMDPAHWPEVRSRARELGLHLESGGSTLLPSTPDQRAAKLDELRTHIRRAKGLGSPLVRTLLAGMRSQLPPGTIEQHIETAAGMLREVRSEVLDAGLKIAIEVHKDLQAWEFKMLLDEVGTDFVGIYLDTEQPGLRARAPNNDRRDAGALRADFTPARLGRLRASARRRRALGPARGGASSTSTRS